MFDRFTERARRTMDLARKQAIGLQADYIGTEHILLALLEEGDGVAAVVLKDLGVTMTRLREEVERSVDSSSVPVLGSHLPLSPRAKRAVDTALAEADNLGHRFAGTEDLLLGLIRDQDSPAFHVLQQGLGLRAEEIRARVLGYVGTEPLPGTDSPRLTVKQLLRSTGGKREAYSYPAPMFDRFTERARQVMTLARQEAQKLNNDYIGTEHLLLGLVEEGSGVAAQVLKNLEVDLHRIRAEVERIIEPGESPTGGAQLPFTPRTKRVLEFALEEAQNLGHSYIGTEHLLLGLIREGDGPATHVLRNLGIQTEEVREEVAEVVGADPVNPMRLEADPSPLRSGWESVPPSPAVDWAQVARLRDYADAVFKEKLPWADSRAYIELLPRPGGWKYLFGVVVSPAGYRHDSLVVTVPGGRLKDLEGELPGLVESLVRSIEGKGDANSANSITS